MGITLNDNSCINSHVKINSYTIDNLVNSFGDDGDNDFWIRDDKQQEKYVGKIGKIEDWTSTNKWNKFVLVTFTDGKQFLFDIFDIDITTEDMTSKENLPSNNYEKLTKEEIALAEKLLIAKFGSSSATDILQSTMKTIVIDCIEASVIFHNKTNRSWNKKKILEWADES